MLVAHGWETLPRDEMVPVAKRVAERLYTQQAGRRRRYVRNQSLYEGRELSEYGPTGYFRGDDFGIETDDPRHLLRSAVQTAVAEVFARQKPKGQFQTSGANWKVRRRAQKLDKLHDGILHQPQGQFAHVWDLMLDAGAECGTQGTAAIFVETNYAEERISHDIVPVCELYTDPAEGRVPRTLWRISPMDSDTVWVRYLARAASSANDNGLASKDDVRRAIRDAEEFYPTLMGSIPGDLSFEGGCRSVKVIEAWRMPLGPDMPGRHVMIVGNVAIIDEPWEAKKPPFVLLHWERHRGSPWGTGIVEDGERSATRSNELEDRLLSRVRVASGKRTFYRTGSLDEKKLQANDEEVFVPVDDGPMPVEAVVQAFTAGEVDFSDRAKREFWDGLGLSQVSAAARREPGVESGVAMRTLNDTKTGRQLVKAKAYETAFVALAEQHVLRARELAKAKPGVVIRWPGGRVLREMKITDALLDDTEFAVTIAEASALPNDPAGRLEMVEELYAMQLISAETFKQLLGWPDIEKEMRSQNAEYEYIDDLIDKFLDADPETWDANDRHSPEGFMTDKMRAISRFASAYFEARRDNAPEFNLQLLHGYIQELDRLLQRMAASVAQNKPQAASETAAPAGAPPAAVAA